MIPISLLSKMCLYEIEIQGVYVKASVVERAVLVDAHIDELRSSFEKPLVAPIVAFDLKANPIAMVQCYWSFVLGLAVL